MRGAATKLALPIELYGHLMYLHSRVNSYVPGVRPSYQELYSTLHRDWETQRPTLEKLLGADLDAINATLARMGQPAIKPVVPPERRTTPRVSA